MARDIQQPQRQVYAPRQTRIAHVPAQESSASGTTKSQDFGRILGGLGQLAGTYAQEKVQQQREIDTADKHKFMANKARYIPEIMQQIEENNLQGAPADEVFSFAQGTEAYQKLYAGFQDEGNLKLIQEDQDAKFLGQFTDWQTQYEQQQRQELLTGAMTSAFAEADPGNYAQLVQEFQADALHIDGPYKMRPEEFTRQAVELAQGYNQAGQFDKAEALLASLEFDDGAAPAANVQLETARAGREQQRMATLKKAWGNAFYGLHNDPELTPEAAREAVDQAASDGLLQSARDREAMYDWLISGGRSSAQNQLQVLTQDKGAGSARTLEGLDNYLRRRSAREAIPEKVREQAREQIIGRKLEVAQSQYLEAMEEYQSDPNDLETMEMAQEAQRSYHEALRFAPSTVQSRLVDLANITTGPNGLPPEDIQELGQVMDQVSEAFRGNLPEALKTYFPDNKQARERLWQLSLLKSAYGDSWEMALVKAYESRGQGPEAQHPTWDDQELYRALRSEVAGKYGVGSLSEFDQLMRLGKMAPLNAAYTMATQVLESNLTTILNKDIGNTILQDLYPGDDRTVSDYYQLKGTQGRAFARAFSERVDAEFGGRRLKARDAIDGQETEVEVEGSNYQYEIIREYIADVIPGLRETTGLALENIPADEAFDADYPVVVEALAPHALHLSIPGIASLGVVTIDTLIEYQKAREARSEEVESQPEGEAERPWPQGKQRSIREQFEYRKTL